MSSAAEVQEFKLAIFTVVVRVPKDENVTGPSVYAVETKNNYYGDIENYSVVEVTP